MISYDIKAADLDSFKEDPNFGTFKIIRKEELSRLWAAIREKQIVSSVKDGFLRNVRLYYDKKGKNGIITPGKIRPVKQLTCQSTGEITRVSDTWKFTDHDGLIDFIKNEELYNSYASTVYPNIPDPPLSEKIQEKSPKSSKKARLSSSDESGISERMADLKTNSNDDDDDDDWIPISCIENRPGHELYVNKNFLKYVAKKKF